MALTILGTPDFRNGPLSPLFSVPGLSYLGQSRRKSPFQGQVWILTWESFAHPTDPTQPSPAEVGWILVPDAFHADLDATGPKYRLTVTTPDIPTGGGQGSLGVGALYYELVGNENQLDLGLHPKALALGAKRVQIIRNVIRGVTNPSTNHIYVEADVTGGIDGESALSGTNATNATTLYRLMLEEDGNRAFNKSQYVFRYNRVAANFAIVDVGYSGVEKIHTTAQMIAQSGAPAGILQAIADAVTQSQPSTIPSGYQFGWLKKTPTATTQAGDKMQISGEFWLDLWSTWIYATAT